MPLLRERGHEALAVDLPAHGDDTDHSPFLSAPEELAEHLHSMASLAADA